MVVNISRVLFLLPGSHVNMNGLVVYLCNSLSSEHLLLRRECIACLRQLAQRHPHELAGMSHLNSQHTSLANPGLDCNVC